jgi:hypothetical protein
MNDDRDRSRDPRRHEYPNYPEVSGTTLPLLATVLAGFAVTIIIQLTLSPGGTGGLAVLAEVSLVAFLLSLLAFLSATAFAVNAQANNYLPFVDLSDTTRQFMQIDDPEPGSSGSNAAGRCTTAQLCSPSMVASSCYWAVSICCSGSTPEVWWPCCSW